MVAPESPLDKSYKDITDLMRKHYGGTKNPRVERTKFREIVRSQGESLQAYSVRLKHAARDCEFGASLNQMLVDQLIAGVQSKTVATKLLDSSKGLKLTFSDAMQLAETAELSEQNAAMYSREKG